MLLGDSCAAIEKRNVNHHSWRMTWSNCIADIQYGTAKKKLLESWLTCKEKNVTSGYGFPQVRFTTSNCTQLPYNISRFYNMLVGSDGFGSRKKDLELTDLTEDFNDLSLALWYFDDGCLQNNNGNEATPRMHISVARYSEKTRDVFKRLFEVVS